MSDSIEMDDLSTKNATGREHRAIIVDDGSISVWAWTSAVLLALCSICLLAFPRFLLFLAEPTGGRVTLTSLEQYLALQLGIILGTLAIAIIAVLPNGWPTGLQPRTDPNWHPFLRPVTAASLVIALLSYGNRAVGTLTTVVLLGSGAVGLLGLWMLVFSGPPAISRKTGADKHTSSLIFRNINAASIKKRVWKRNQSE